MFAPSIIIQLHVCLPDSLLLVVLVGVRCVQGGVAVTAGLPESFTMVSYLISHYFITIPL